MLRIVALSICDHLPRSTALSTHNHLPRNAALNSEVSLKRHSVCLGFRISVHERFQGSLKVPAPRRYACKDRAVRTHMPEDPAKRGVRMAAAWRFDRYTAICVQGQRGAHAYARRPCETQDPIATGPAERPAVGGMGARARRGGEMLHAYARRPCEIRDLPDCRMAIRPAHGDMRARIAWCARIPLLTWRDVGSDGGWPCKTPGPQQYACVGREACTHRPEGSAIRGVRWRLARPNARPSVVSVRPNRAKRVLFLSISTSAFCKGVLMRYSMNAKICAG